MEISANAKINLTLDILRRREDGYHELQMVMQAVSLADHLTVVPARGTEGTAASDLHFLPTGGKNLAQIAAAAFRAATGLGGPVDVTIQKRVPVCAGLAGGSADAAAVLRAMDELTGAGLSPVELAKIGEGVGSDVPFCVLGGTALAEGRPGGRGPGRGGPADVQRVRGRAGAPAHGRDPGDRVGPHRLRGAGGVHVGQRPVGVRAVPGPVAGPGRLRAPQEELPGRIFVPTGMICENTVHTVAIRYIGRCFS